MASNLERIGDTNFLQMLRNSSYDNSYEYSRCRTNTMSSVSNDLYYTTEKTVVSEGCFLPVYVNFDEPEIDEMEDSSEKSKSADFKLESIVSGIKSAASPYREEFMARYNIDEETMELVESWLASYNPEADNEFEKVILDMQGMSETEWANMDDDMKQKYAATIALYAYAGYAVEHGDASTEGIETYQNICGDITESLYKVEWGNEENGFNNANVTLNTELVSLFSDSLKALGAEDSLSENILTKLKNDTNEYYEFLEYNDVSGFNVNINYTEEGLVEVTVGDTNLEHGDEVHSFLAFGKDKATSLYSDIRNDADNPDKHGLTEEELIGMIMSVENKNDMQIMENILSSDMHFEINGQSAFCIDYDKNNGEGFYDKDISDNFSIALASMGTLMLYHGATTSYEEYMDAALIASYGDINSHNIVLDICTGAGLYADVCAVAVFNDEEGGDNDTELERMLNAANANYGAWGQLYINTKYETQTNPNGPKEEDYVDFHCMNLKYDYNTGEIAFDVYCDYKYPVIAGMSGGVTQYEQVEDRKFMFRASSEMYIGELSSDQKLESEQQKLKEELERKREGLVFDTVVGLVGDANPIVGDVLSSMKDLADGEKYDATGDTTCDIIGKVFEDNVPLCHGASSLNTVIGAFFGNDKIGKQYDEKYEKTLNLQKLLMGYSYNKGARAVGIYNYDMIRIYQNWNEKGISSIFEGINNEDVYELIIQDGRINVNSVTIIAETLLDKDENYFIHDDGTAYNYTEVMNELKSAGYLEEEINAAMEYFILGENADQSIYDSFMDIPFDFRHACADAISLNSELGMDVYSAL